LNKKNKTSKTGKNPKNITEQKEVLLNVISDLIILQDTNHRVLWANKAAYDAKCTAKKFDEIVGHYCYEIWGSSNKPCEGCPVAKSLKTGKIEEKEIPTPDGRKWLVRGHPIKDKKGNVVNVLEVTRETTEKQKLEQALRDSEQLYKTLVDTSPYAVTVTDLKAEITYASKRTLKLHGYKNQEELLGKSAFILITPSEHKKAMTNLKKTLETGSVRNLEYHLVKKDGSTFLAEMNASSIKDSEGKPQALVACTRDITERKENERKLKEREAFNFALFNYSPVETIVVDREGKVIKSNLAKRRSGNRIPEIGNIMYKDYGSKHEINMFKELMNCINTGKNKEFPQMKYEDKYLSISIAPFSEGAIIISEDITERISAEKALKESEDRFRSIVETVPSLLLITNEKGENIYMSPNCKDITGYSNGELEGKFIWWVHKDDEEKAKEIFRIAFVEHKGGRNFEYKAVNKDGKIWYASSSWEPIVDEKGKFEGVVLQTIDISDRKIMEEEIAKVQKLESIGILAGGIAHDFNNFLTGIIGNISLAKLKLDPKNEAYEILTESEKAAHSAKSLTHQLLTFSKGGVPIKEKASIEDLIRESTNFVLVGSNIKCEFDFQKDLWDVHIDIGQMNQVINNIILNASEAMPRGGKITIKAENIEIGRQRKIPLEKGKYVKVTIRDTGIGILKEHLSKIFDPFFTTKRKGSGLGLSTVFSIIQKHKGYVYADSETGIGTSFYIYLPVVVEPEKETEPEEEKKQFAKDEGRVLIMDDKSFIRKAAQRALNLFGFEVNGAEDGEEAIMMYKEAIEKGTPYNVVILDLTIPGAMGGLKTLKELRKINPEVKAVVSSGYSDDPVMSDHVKFGFDAIIKKPYEYTELAEVVKNLIKKK
jgi:two-component system cell cycle sensor histidine kinase/response regulator CckA